MDFQIESRNVEMTSEWQAEIDARMTQLQTAHVEITHARMTLTKDVHHRHGSKVAEALLVVSLPGRHTITARKQDKTVEEAIRAAFAAMQIELRRYREKWGSREISVAAPPLRGVISKLFPEQGYGFILRDGGSDVYFHRHAVHGFMFEALEEGTEVAFNVEEGEQGPQATTVNPAPLELR